MKKIALLVIAFALIIGMTQCKKKAATPISDNSIQITLSANNGGDEKTSFDGEGFIWSGADEYIYVGGNNASGCIGTLRIVDGSISVDGKNANFTGSIDNSANNTTLYFFYLGKSRDGSAVTTLDFSKQDGTLANVTDYHVAIGSADYSGGTEVHNVRFDMKMAIARFNTSGFDGSVYIHGDGIYSEATVDYQTGTITGTTKGYNLIGAATTDCYVAMIPQPTPAETNVKFESGAHTGKLTFVRGIEAGKYYCDNGGSLAVNAGDPITGVVKGLFAVEGASGIITKMVRFAPGNLQYQASTSTWRFAENQWDYVGDATSGNVYVSEVKSNNASISSSYTGWIDLFGWGTSGIDGYSPIATCYQPYSTSTTNGQYNPYGSTSTNLYDGGDNAGKADWGYAASAANLGGYSTWRTLTKDEWVYVFNTRTVNGGTGSGKSYTLGQSVNGMLGVVLYPDDYTGSVYSGSDWSTFESAGCVFLPAAGYRNGTSVSYVGSGGVYWSSSYNGSNLAYYAGFYSGNVTPQGSSYRRNGYSVRLARVVE